jgi:hypothetical protein
VVSVYAFAKSDFISDRIETLVKASLEPILRQQIQIAKSELAFFPPSAVMTEVTSQGKLSLSVKKIQISLSLWSLLTQSLFIKNVLIENPTVSFGPDVDLHLKSQSNKMVVRRIQIKEGIFSYRANQQEFYLPHLHAVIAPNFKMDRFNVTLSGKDGRVLFAQQEKNLDQFGGTFVAHSKGIDFTQISAKSNDTELALEGVLLFSGVMPQAFVMPGTRGSNVGLNIQMTASIPIEEILPVSNTRRDFSGRMIMKGRVTGTVQNPTASGKIVMPRLFFKEDELGSVSTDFSYQNKKGDFKNIRAKIFSGEVFGEAIVHFPEGAAFSEKGSHDLTLRYNHLALYQAVNAFVSHEQGYHFYGLFGKGEIKLSGQAKDTINGSGSLTLKRESSSLMIADKPTPKDAPTQMEVWQEVVQAIPKAKPLDIFSLVTEGKWDFTKNANEIRVDQGTLSMKGGQVYVEGLIQSENGMSLNGSLEITEVKPVADILGAPITGKLHLSGALTGSFDKPSFSGKLGLKDWTLVQQALGVLQTDLLYQDKTLTFREGLLIGQLRPMIQDDDPFYKIAGSFRLAQPNKPPAYVFSVEAHSVDSQEIPALFMKPIPLLTTATGSVSIKGVGKQFIVSGPMTVGEGSLYGERFKNGKVLLTVNEKEVRLQNTFLSKEVPSGKGDSRSAKSMTAEGEGEISYQGAYRIDVKTSPLFLEHIDLLQRLQSDGPTVPLPEQKPPLSGAMALTVSGEGTFKHPVLEMTAVFKHLQYHDAAMEAGNIHVNWQDQTVTVLSAFPQKDFSFMAEIVPTKPYPFTFRTHFTNLPIHPFLKRSWLNQYDLDGLSIYSGGNLSGKGMLEKIKEADLTADLKTLSAALGDYWLTNDGPVQFVAEKGNFLIERGSFKGINTDLAFSGRVTPFKNLGLIVKGSADMNLLRLFTPKVRAGSGIAQIDIRITDQWATPNIQGVLSLQSGNLSLVNFSDPILISDLSLVFNRNLLILETIAGKLGRGQFSGFGKAVLAGLDLTSFGFQFDLKQMPVRLAQDIETVMEGTLLFQGTAEEQLLDGSLHVQKALYEKRINLREMLAKWQESQEERLPITVPFAGTTRLSIHLFGKDNLAIRNNIAKVPLETDLFLKGTLEKPMLFGQIDIPRGTFSFRANEFKVTSGMVQFANPEKIDPLFDIKGQSRVRDYAIDFSLTGTLAQFVLGLTSIPPLPNDDILSLLTIGKTTQEFVAAGGAITSIVSDFVAGFLAEPVQQLTGLDKISVGVPEGKSSKSTLLVVEKRVLDDRLLIVSSTTFDSKEQPKLKIYYNLGKHVSLAGEKDEQGRLGGDLRFRFEFK